MIQLNFAGFAVHVSVFKPEYYSELQNHETFRSKIEYYPFYVAA